MCAAVFKLGVDYTIIQWVRATLDGLLAAATLGGFSRMIAVPRACPQRGVLSPLLWCLDDDLIGWLIGEVIKTQIYANDISLLAVGIFPNTVSGPIQWALYAV